MARRAYHNRRTANNLRIGDMFLYTQKPTYYDGDIDHDLEYEMFYAGEWFSGDYVFMFCDGSGAVTSHSPEGFDYEEESLVPLGYNGLDAGELYVVPADVAHDAGFIL